MNTLPICLATHNYCLSSSDWSCSRRNPDSGCVALPAAVRERLRVSPSESDGQIESVWNPDYGSVAGSPVGDPSTWEFLEGTIWTPDSGDHILGGPGRATARNLLVTRGRVPGDFLSVMSETETPTLSATESFFRSQPRSAAEHQPGPGQQDVQSMFAEALDMCWLLTISVCEESVIISPKNASRSGFQSK